MLWRLLLQLLLSHSLFTDRWRKKKEQNGSRWTETTHTQTQQQNRAEHKDKQQQRQSSTTTHVLYIWPLKRAGWRSGWLNSIWLLSVARRCACSISHKYTACMCVCNTQLAHFNFWTVYFERRWLFFVQSLGFICFNSIICLFGVVFFSVKLKLIPELNANNYQDFASMHTHINKTVEPMKREEEDKNKWNK